MIKDIIVKNYNSFILLENGDLWGCGSNSCGKLGLGYNKLIDTFVKICDNVEKIKCYSYETFLFKKDKTLWFAGYGAYLGRKENITPFIKIDDNVKDVLFLELPIGKFLFCLKNDGDLLDLIENRIYLSNVDKMIKGYKGKESCLFVISKDSSLFYFEEGGFNKIDSLSEVKNVFSCYNSPIFIQKIDNSLWEIKDYNFEKSVKIFDNIKDVKGDDFYSASFPPFGFFFLKKNGDLFVLGNNCNGELGINQEKVDIPTLVTKNVKEIYYSCNFTFILKNDNSLWGCGSNRCNILGNESEYYNFYSFKKICDDVKKFYVDGESLFIIKQNDELWCSGKVARYFQGNDYLKFISNNVKNVFSNSFSFFIFKKDNTLLCFGDNEKGELGIGSKEKLVENPIEYTAIKNYYNTKETVNVIKDVFGGKSL